MCAVIASAKGVNLYLVAVTGGLASIPLIVLMVYLTIEVGVHAAIAATVATDILTSAVMGAFRLRYAVEIILIALFVWLGVDVAAKTAPLVESLLRKP